MGFGMRKEGLINTDDFRRKSRAAALEGRECG